MLGNLMVTIMQWLGNYVWLVQIPFTICIFWVVYRLSSILLKRFERLSRLRYHWIVGICIKSIRKPMQFLFVTMNIVVLLVIIQQNTNTLGWFSQHRAIKVFLGIFVMWGIISFIRFTQEHMIYFSKKVYDKTAILAFGQIGILITVLLLTLIIMQFMGVNFAGLLAFGGFSGIAVGFAAKDLFANFLGAMMIYMDNPFKVGDWVSSPEKEIEGEVESIGWRQTKIITFEKRPIYVPNSVFSTIVVQNASRMTHRRFDEIIGVRYDDLSKINNIVKDIKEMIDEHSNTDSSQLMTTYVVKFNASSVDIRVICFATVLPLAEYSVVHHQILLGIANIIQKHGANIAFPTTTIHLQSVPESSANSTSLENLVRL